MYGDMNLEYNTNVAASVFVCGMSFECISVCMTLLNMPDKFVHDDSLKLLL